MNEQELTRELHLIAEDRPTRQDLDRRLHRGRSRSTDGRRGTVALIAACGAVVLLAGGVWGISSLTQAGSVPPATQALRPISSTAATGSAATDPTTGSAAAGPVTTLAGQVVGYVGGAAKCFTAADLSAKSARIVFPENDAQVTIQTFTDTCGSMWGSGEIRADAPFVDIAPQSQIPAPPPTLSACILSDGVVGVFPGASETCTTLGLPIAVDR